MATHQLELGLDTFGDVTSAAGGGVLSHAQVIRNVIEEAVLADSLGIDFIGLGEHHRGLKRGLGEIESLERKLAEMTVEVLPGFFVGDDEATETKPFFEHGGDPEG